MILLQNDQTIDSFQISRRKLWNFKAHKEIQKYIKTFCELQIAIMGMSQAKILDCLNKF